MRKISNKWIESTNVKKKKLSYKEQQELQQLPELIEQLEAEQGELTAKINQADFYRQDAQTVATTLDRLKILDEHLQQTYARWDELEALSKE